jgi:outer membrane protein assembly factor BamD (BamD/ComL family)
MSVTGISSSGFSDYGAQSVQKDQVAQEFQQLGQDLQAGNLSAAQSDFATLQQLVSQAGSAASSASSSSSSSQSGNPLAQAFSQLATDLKSGNLTAAQQDFAQIQKDFQNLAAQNQPSGDNGAGLPYHHHRGGSNSTSQLFQQLGQSLQSGNLTSAQSAFATLQQDLQQFSAASANADTSSQAGTTGVSVSA